MPNPPISVYAVEELVRFKSGPRWCINEVFYRRQQAWYYANKLIESSQAWARPLKRCDVRTVRLEATHG